MGLNGSHTRYSPEYSLLKICFSVSVTVRGLEWHIQKMFHMANPRGTHSTMGHLNSTIAKLCDPVSPLCLQPHVWKRKTKESIACMPPCRHLHCGDILDPEMRGSWSSWAQNNGTLNAGGAPSLGYEPRWHRLEPHHRGLSHGAGAGVLLVELLRGAVWGSERSFWTYDLKKNRLCTKVKVGKHITSC